MHEHWTADGMWITTGNFTPGGLRLSDAGYRAAGIGLSLIASFGIFNNLVVIVVLLLHRQLLTPVNILILNLTIRTPFTAASAFQHHWLFGRSGCVAYAFATGFSGIASIGSLAVISWERYWLVAHAGSSPITTRETILITCGVWTYALLGVLPPVVGWSRFEIETPNIACGPHWESEALPDLSYIVYLTVFALVLPLSVISWSYIQIVLFLRKNSQSISAQSVSKTQANITRMVIVMVMAFLLAWMPYAIVSAVVLFGGSHLITAPIATLPAIFAKSSIIYNPIIYAIMNPQFRIAFKNVFCRKSYAVLCKHGAPIKRSKEKFPRRQLPTDGAPSRTRVVYSFSSIVTKIRDRSSTSGGVTESQF
ncbi:putative Rhodopsin, G0-coupled [Hypsibius exemplaris]|uniref:Rhodopsin, G0-coupled n=1 Tax=Hypsibius exemplaris TaxID=2072580 RepID=A0A1W0WG34_HYPEX|nr:putative Rhodopsin, G0-coupled [Hypsibius exemplaris]